MQRDGGLSTTTAVRDRTQRVLTGSGSSDPDVLYAAKTLYASTFARQRFVGLIGIVVGLALIAGAFFLTAALGVVGVPIVVGGIWFWRRGLQSLAVVDETYAAYMSALPMISRASPPFGFERRIPVGPASAPADFTPRTSSLPYRPPSKERSSGARNLS